MTSSNNSSHHGNPTLAFAGLQPDDVLNALDGLGIHCDGRLLTLNSYENRVYQVGTEDGRFVVAKFYRPERWSDAAILEEHAFSAELHALDIPVVPPVVIEGRSLHKHGPFRLSVAECHPGRPPELDDADLLEQLGRLVARIHLHGEIEPFSARPALTIDDFGERSADFLLENRFIPVELEGVYEGLVEYLLDAVEDCFERAGDVAWIRLHGDFHPGNVLVQNDRLHIVDLDDARMGPAVQDLWMFLSGDRAEQTPQLASLLAGYEQFRRFDARELWLVEGLRTLRIMHYAAWIARRWEDPAFRTAFPWFDTRKYWDEHILSLREQQALMQEAPLVWQSG